MYIEFNTNIELIFKMFIERYTSEGWKISIKKETKKGIFRITEYYVKLEK